MITATVTSFSSAIDSGQTVVTEPNDQRIGYTTPHFRASASVKIGGVPEKTEAFSVGFIQAVTAMTYKIYYSDGYSSWKFKRLPVSDSDGNYPWYGVSTEKSTLNVTKNIAANSTLSVSMNDNFAVNVSLQRPQDAATAAPQLRRVLREQAFSCWLVLRQDATKKLTLLRQADWALKVDISVDLTQPRGSRCTVDNITQSPVSIYTAQKISQIPANCLVAPNANGSQNLIWMPEVWQGVSGKIVVL